jgi:hypothetical protein
MVCGFLRDLIDLDTAWRPGWRLLPETLKNGGFSVAGQERAKDSASGFVPHFTNVALTSEDDSVELGDQITNPK